MNPHLIAAAENPNERQFLHTMATPLSAVIFVVDGILDDLQKARPNDLVASQLLLAHAALEKVRFLLEARREYLIKQGVPSART
jgi:hypothetical protein